MHDFIRQIEKANDAGLYFMSLYSALTVPDICGALESENGWASPSKYALWFNRWVAPKYALFGGTSLSGEVCYSYRCAVLHQGRSARPNMPYKRVLFIEPGTSGILAHNNVINDALNIDVKTFCSDIVEACRAWLGTVEGTQPYESNWSHSMRRHPTGLAPYIGGLPVIG